MKKNANIYVMTDGTSLKVGHSIAPQARAKQIGRPVDILHLTDIIVEAEAVERTAHRLLKISGKHVRGEWFSASLEEAVEAINLARRIVDGLELPLDRVPKPKPKRSGVMVVVKLLQSTVAAIDEERARHHYPPSRAQVIKRALEEWSRDKRRKEEKARA